MPQGVVVWFDERTEETIRHLWADLAALGVPALGMPGRRHARPHLTYFYGDSLDLERTIEALETLPALGEVPVRLGSVGVFPRSVLHLAVTPTEELLLRHRRVVGAAAHHVRGRHAIHQPDRWTPHVTLAGSVPPELMSAAVDLCADRLPVEGALATGGIEDGLTGESWLVPSLP